MKVGREGERRRDGVVREIKDRERVKGNGSLRGCGWGGMEECKSQFIIEARHMRE